VILVGGFEPFGGRRRNRSWDAARRLEGQSIAGHAIALVQLPVVYARLQAVATELIARAPAFVLLVGESAQARTLLVERLAVNVAHARLADNAGARPLDQELERGGEVARRVRFDPRRAADAARAAGVPCDVSSHAGTFCCNALLYHALGAAAGSGPPVAFVHVPARWPWARDRRAARGLAAVLGALL
jgi:pyroglutamyl-peptidase